MIRIKSVVQVLVTFVLVFGFVAALILFGVWRADQTRPGTIVTPMTADTSAVEP